MPSKEIDRIQRAAAIVVQVEGKFPFPTYSSTLHPIRLIKQAEQQIASTCCVACGARSSSLEQHHIAGRANCQDSVTLCKTCHDEVTNIYQSKWLPWEDEERDTLRCYFLGLSDLFHLIWRKTGDPYFYELSKAYALNARYVR